MREAELNGGNSMFSENNLEPPTPKVSEEVQKTSFWYWFADLITTLVIVATFVVLIRVFLFSPFHVSGPSMCNTINYIKGECQNGYGEYIIVNKAIFLNFGKWQVSSPSRNDIIVFKPDYEEAPYLIKRVIGLPGDKVVIRDGRVYLQKLGETEPSALAEAYLSAFNYGQTTIMGSTAERIYEVPEGSYFVMGDNRKHSTDSRTCFGQNVSSCKADSEIAFVPRENIAGKAWITLWPSSKIRFLSHL